MLPLTTRPSALVSFSSLIVPSVTDTTTGCAGDRSDEPKAGDAETLATGGSTTLLDVFDVGGVLEVFDVGGVLKVGVVFDVGFVLVALVGPVGCELEGVGCELEGVGSELEGVGDAGREEGGTTADEAETGEPEAAVLTDGGDAVPEPAAPELVNAVDDAEFGELEATAPSPEVQAATNTIRPMTPASGVERRAENMVGTRPWNVPTLKRHPQSPALAGTGRQNEG